MPESAVGQLGAFIAATSPSSVPPARLDQAKILLLDAIGCALLGGEYRLSRLAGDFAASVADGGPASFWFQGRSGTIEDCSFVNSMLVHNPLTDDTMAWSHPSCNIMPSAVAVGEAQNSTGRDLLTAIALGYEVQYRIAPDRVGRALFAKGYHGSAAPGAFGASAAAAYLLGLNAAQAASALAIAASTCSPAIEEPITVGTDERSIHMAANTRSGVQAAQMARVGFEGAPTALEGPMGFYRIFLDQDAPDELLRDLGSEWIFSELRQKIYPTAFRNTFAVWSAAKVARDPAFDADAVESITVRILPWGSNTGYAFGGPFTTVEQALYATKFAVAVTLLNGTDDFATLLRSVGDAKLDVLAAKTTSIGEEPPTGIFGTDGRIAKYGHVEVVLKDGTTISADASDMPDTQIWHDWDAQVEKFLRWTDGVLPAERQRAIVSIVDSLSGDGMVADLVEALRAAEPEGARS